MTQPILAGYPDYQTQSLQSSIVIKSLSGFTASGTIYGPFYCGAMPFVTVDAQVVTPRATVQIGWFSDLAATILVGRDELNIAPGIPGRITLPVIAPYMSITVSFAGGVTDLITGSVVMSASKSNQASGPDAILLSAQGVAILNGAAINVNTTLVRAGVATFTGATGAPTYTFELYAIDANGSVFYLTEFNQVQGRRPYLVNVPAMPLRVTIRNGALNTVYNVALVMAH